MEKWLFIRSGSNDAFTNMALDDALLDSVIAGEICNPVLRFYTWSKPSISIGRLQKIKKDIRLDLCERDNINIVRRPTGGRAVFHETENNELTYSIILPSKHSLAHLGIESTYRKISQAFVMGLKKLHIPAQLEKKSFGNKQYVNEISCFSAITRSEIQLMGQKIIGSAQARRKGAVLQQGSILLHSNNLNEFYFTNKQFDQKGIFDLMKKLWKIQVFQQMLLEGFRELLSIEFETLESLPERLIIRAVHARHYKYSDSSWNFLK